MSQFLICKSKENLSDYGYKLKDVISNKDLMQRVGQKYFDKEDEIWVIESIHEMLNSLEENMITIRDIAQKSQEMIFWYGTEYDGLDNLYSVKELMDYLQNEYKNPCLELYLHVTTASDS